MADVWRKEFRRMNEKKTTGEKLRTIIDKLGTLVLMNMAFLVASLPIVTIGPAWNGLLMAVRYNVRGDKWFEGFRFGFKTRFWRSFLLWVLMLPAFYFFVTEINFHWQQEQLVPLLAATFVFALLSIFTFAMQILNVYIPTKVSVWMHNAFAMMKTGFIRLLATTALYWAPMFMLLLWPEPFFYLVLIFIAVYYSLTALVSTMFLKENLVDFLLDARADGTLLAEEGKNKDKDEE